MFVARQDVYNGTVEANEHLPALLKTHGLSDNGFVSQYRAHSLIGQGGMGIVLGAFDERLQREVALKILKPELARSENARKLFLAEARAVANLSHENIVAIFDVGETRGLPFLAMERLQGESLAALLKQGFPISDQQALRIGVQVCEGLEEAHRCGIVHRDIKPANIFLELPRGRIKLLDFGLARSLFAAEQKAVLVGTPGYMSPEQARDEPVDHRADIYAVGVLLYRLLSGKLPFGDHDAATLMVKLLTEDPVSLARHRTDLPTRTVEVVDRCIRGRLSERPQSVVEVRDLLNQQIEDASNGTAESPLLIGADVTRGNTTAPKRPWAIISVITLAALITVFFAAQRWWNHTEIEPPTAATAKSNGDPFVGIDDSPRGSITPRIPDERPDNNVPVPLQKGVIVRPEHGRGADAFAQFENEADVGENPFLLVSNQRSAKSLAYIRFDLSPLAGRKQQVIDVHFLLTLAKNETEADRSLQTWECSCLRDDAEGQLWEPSGENRIAFVNAPGRVVTGDLIQAGTIRGSLSKWYEDDRIMLLRHVHAGLAEAIKADTDNLLTLSIRSREREFPDANFVSSEGPAGFSPCLVIRLSDEVAGKDESR